MAAEADISVANWYAIEQERIKVLPLPTLRRIEQVLGVWGATVIRAKMIDPQTINLLALPSVLLEKEPEFPTTPKIYVAIDRKKILLN
ncbi:helix-turn-helix domain-containing protein [Nostoc sp. 'Peltigera malacea cyanobiont' DB3992]|uniref:helix-turn-helix domain-containing protein n=1 Tax=Nostoc sp. 'Peltigera malacea cyanobiont' DB3992 TaxID=1206980 RepID=UPI000C03ADD9|nr:helix-turn-helix domain-containing protein [Nostoc sp. 'Peltigera malacea cyanobiont' DB3992]PHM10984.1 hypothetical protein CK516_05260 [Nostoc sp. 'Peltigera malacea cyanobiont' DB3992]